MLICSYLRFVSLKKKKSFYETIPALRAFSLSGVLTDFLLFEIKIPVVAE